MADVHRLKESERHRDYYMRNRERILERKRRYYQENKQTIIARTRAYKTLNVNQLGASP